MGSDRIGPMVFSFGIVLGLLAGCAGAQPAPAPTASPVVAPPTRTAERPTPTATPRPRPSRTPTARPTASPTAPIPTPTVPPREIRAAFSFAPNWMLVLPLKPPEAFPSRIQDEEEAFEDAVWLTDGQQAIGPLPIPKALKVSLLQHWGGLSHLTMWWPWEDPKAVREWEQRAFYQRQGDTWRICVTLGGKAECLAALPGEPPPAQRVEHIRCAAPWNAPQVRCPLSPGFPRGEIQVPTICPECVTDPCQDCEITPSQQQEGLRAMVLALPHEPRILIADVTLDRPQPPMSVPSPFREIYRIDLGSGEIKPLLPPEHKTPGLYLGNLSLSPDERFALVEDMAFFAGYAIPLVVRLADGQATALPEGIALWVALPAASEHAAQW
ncbi:hypothetical protein [Thermoflexus sp.]|uniref:hypothetical protein n=1 Tax=Thermoflexus sp. TaxID=1969742 RepID=UPI00332CAAFE